MESLEVDIIINNYNYGRFLQESIDSALAQTYCNTKVVVVDDGSTDESREVIARFGDRIRTLYKDNGGQASALNAGFAASKGELIIFLDSDDSLLPGAVQAVVSSWRNGVARIRYPLEVIDGLGNSLGRYIGAARPPKVTLGPFGIDSPTSGNAYSREVLNRIMPIPEENWKLYADAYLTLASSLFGEVVSLKTPLGKYRIHGQNYSRQRGLADTRRTVTGVFELYSALSAFSGDTLGTCEEWLSAYPQHWVARIISLRTSPTDHPWNDRLSGLLRRAVSATWRQPYWNFRKKVLYSLIVTGYGLAPRRVADILRQIEGSRGRTLSGRLCLRQ